MKKFYRLFIYGATIHPGNVMYLILIVIAGIAMSNNDSVGRVKGFLCGIAAMSILLAPLYIYTSYAVGKANAPQNVKETSAQTHNSDYAAALRVFEEWKNAEGFGSSKYFIEYCEKRLNSAKAPNCA